MKAQFDFKPGTVALIIFIALTGYVAFDLVSGNIDQLGESAEEDQDEALDCSELDVDFIRVNTNSTHTSIFFMVNTDLEGVEVGFEESNETALVRGIRPNTMANTTISVGNPENVYVDTGRCNNPFWWR